VNVIGTKQAIATIATIETVLFEGDEFTSNDPKAAKKMMPNKPRIMKMSRFLMEMFNVSGSLFLSLKMHKAAITMSEAIRKNEE